MRKIINFRTATFTAIGLICGILFSFYIIIENLFGAVASLVFATVVFVAFTFFSSAQFKGAGRSLCLIVFIVCLFIGGMWFYNSAGAYKNADLGGHVLTVTGKVGEIGIGENNTQIIVKDVEVSGAINGRCRYKISLIVYGENNLRLGDLIKFKACLKDKTLIYNGKFSASFLAQGIKYYAEENSEDIEKLAAAPNIFENCNLYIFDTLKKGLKENEFPIAYAMLTGNSDYIVEENLTAFRIAGVAHIFAVSGLHIGFLATALYFLLEKLKVNKSIAFIITLGICVFYSGVCGFSASSLRAVIMFFFLNIAKIAGLKYDGISSVSVAALFILIISPAQLFCVGFQLSFTVVLSIIILYNPLTRLLKFLPKKIAAAIAVSFAAEVGGAPVLLYAFGGFASLSLLVNLLFIPLAGALFVSLVVGTLLGGIISPIVSLFLPEYGIAGLNFIVQALNLKTFMIGGFAFGGFAAAYYGVIVLSGGLVNLKRKVNTVLCIILSVVCIVGTWTTNNLINSKLRIQVLGSDNLSAAFFTLKDQNILVISDISYKTFSQYRLQKAAENCSGEFSVILLRQEKTVDMLAMLIRLRHIINATRLYYYGEKDEEAESVITKTLAGFTVAAMSDGDGIPFGNGKCEFSLDGRCLMCTANGQNTAVFSSFIGVFEFETSDIKSNTAICLNTFEGIAKYYSPEKIVSFKSKSGYNDGETHGNLVLLI